MWKIIIYKDKELKSEILDYVYKLKDSSKAKFFSWLSKLSEEGPNLHRPYSDLIEDGIHELRIKLTRNQIRILYFFCFKEYIILTNLFIKNTDQIPSKEIKKSKLIRSEFLERINESEIGRLYDRDIRKTLERKS